MLPMGALNVADTYANWYPLVSAVFAIFVAHLILLA